MTADAARAVPDVFAGTPGRLYDPRAPGVIADYRRVAREVAPGRARLELERDGARLEVIVRVTPVAVGTARPANAAEVEDVLLTFAGAAAMEDPADRGALEHYREVERREEGGATVLTLQRRGGKSGLEVAIATRGLD